MKAETIGQAFCNGFEDRMRFGWVGFWDHRQVLYQDWKLRTAWNCGWRLCHLLTNRPLSEPNERAKVVSFYCARAPLTPEQISYGEEVADRINVANMGGQPRKS